MSTCRLPEASIACICATLSCRYRSLAGRSAFAGRTAIPLSNVVGAQRRGGGRRGFARLLEPAVVAVGRLPGIVGVIFMQPRLGNWVGYCGKAVNRRQTLIVSANYSALTVVTTPLSAPLR